MAKKTKKVEEANQDDSQQAQASPFPQDVNGLAEAGWNHTHMASNGNKLYTSHHPVHGHKYAEVDADGKVVDVRGTQNAVSTAGQPSAGAGAPSSAEEQGDVSPKADAV